jgi:hypothetical protein
MWNTIKVYGEGFETQNINVNVYLSDKSDYSNFYVACGIPTSSPYTIDLSSVSPIYRKDYLYYEITFKD